MKGLSKCFSVYGFIFLFAFFAACGDDDKASSPEEEEGEELVKQSSESSKAASSSSKDGNLESSSSVKAPKFVSGSFVDERDGKRYATVTVNRYTWMAENLQYETSNAVDSAGVFYYNGYEAEEACPSGWHLPSKEEWEDLLSDVASLYDDDAIKLLKSTIGWEAYEDTIDCNGVDSIGFNMEPFGYVLGSSSDDPYYDNAGRTATFWTSSLTNRGYPMDYRAHIGAEFSNIGDPFYSAMNAEGFLLNVRCLKNDNTMAGSVGSCTEKELGRIYTIRDHYYVCDTSGWELAYRDEILNSELGECNSDKEEKVVVFRDTAFICHSGETEWDVATLTEALGICSRDGENDKTIKMYQGIPYYCDYRWEPATANQYLPTCDSANNTVFEKFRDTLYTCDAGWWKIPTETQIALGTCDKNLRGDVVAVGDSQFVCMNHFWRPLSILELNLGVCTKDGDKKSYKKMNFVCDASRNLWKGILKGESKNYGVVAVDTLLWLTDNVTKTHWSSAISDESNGVSYCPSGWIMPSYEEWSNMMRYVAQYGGFSAEFTLDTTSAIYGLNMVEERQVDYWVPSQKYSCSDSHDEVICRADAVEIYEGSARMSMAWACEYTASAGVCTSTSAIRCVLRP